jgi:hypothetical protein
MGVTGITPEVLMTYRTGKVGLRLIRMDTLADV